LGAAGADQIRTAHKHGVRAVAEVRNEHRLVVVEAARPEAQVAHDMIAERVAGGDEFRERAAWKRKQGL
jgi:hypothetical protein